MYAVKKTNLIDNVSSYSIHYGYVDAWDAIGRTRLDMDSIDWVEDEDYAIDAPVEMAWDEIAGLYEDGLLDQDAVELYEIHQSEAR